MTGWFTRARVSLVLALSGGGLLACNAFRLTGPENAPIVSPPRLVDITIEYRQPQFEGCPPDRCNDPVVFFGSWMKPGGEFLLNRDPGGFIWRGRAIGVPVNFPPRDDPHAVRVYDPHLVDTPTVGATASRLRIGGQILTVFDSFGTDREVGLVYVDDNGQGRNPF